MATISAAGVGSGLDVNSLVQQLVAAEGAPLSQRITTREVKLTAQISALGTLKGALSSFKASMETLKTETAFSPRKVTVSDDTIFAATTGSTAAPGTYSIEVIDLASGHQLASGPFLGGATSVVGTGTLTITQGSTSFNVTIDSTNNTLAGIRSAINDATGNTGVQATLIHETNGSHLVLTSTQTGAASAIEVAASGGDNGLNQLVYDPGGTENLDETQPARDAHVRIAGFNHYSATNTVSGAIDDVTLTLKEADAGTVYSLNVTYDTTLVTDRIKKFVSEYNSLYDKFKSLRSYSVETKVGGPMLGDSMLRGIEERIRRDLSNPVTGLTGSYTTLASVGVTRQLDGKLALDEAKLSTAIGTDRAAVAAIFGSETGVAARLYANLETHLATNGDVTARDKSLKDGIDQIKKDKEALALRMQAVEARYRRQFTALDTLLSRMQSTSSYLASQLSNLPTPNGN